MELYEAINKRKTTREFLDTEVEFEVIKRIEWRVCFQIKSFRYYLVCNRKYLFSGNSRRTILLNAYTAE